MSIGYLGSLRYWLQKPEPIRQSGLLTVLACGVGSPSVLTASLDALNRQSGGEWQQMLGQLQRMLQSGRSLSDALSALPGILPQRTMLAVQAAEEDGTLREVLADESLRLSKTHTGPDVPGLSRPETTILQGIVLLNVVFAGIAFIMIWIIPKLKSILSDFDTGLPPTLRFMISAADWCSQYGFLLVIPVVLIPVATISGILWIRLRCLRLGDPPFAEHWPRYWLPTTLRSIGRSIAAGGTAEGCLQGLIREIPPGRASASYRRVLGRCESGISLEDAMQAERLLTSREARLLRSSAVTGNSDWALLHLSDGLENRFRRWTQFIGALMPTLLIMAIGALVLLCGMSIVEVLTTMTERSL